MTPLANYIRDAFLCLAVFVTLLILGVLIQEKLLAAFDGRVPMLLRISLFVVLVLAGFAFYYATLYKSGARLRKSRSEGSG
jgi:hypothetical protein